MSTQWSYCNSCKEMTNHTLVFKCPKCGSADIEWDRETIRPDRDSESDESEE